MSCDIQMQISGLGCLVGGFSINLDCAVMPDSPLQRFIRVLYTYITSIYDMYEQSISGIPTS